MINLREQFGDRYRIGFDPAYDHRNVPRAKLDPSMMTIPCQGKGVTIYAYSDTHLAVDVDGRPGITKSLMTFPGLVLWQDGNIEKTFLFPVSLFPEVAQIVKPRRRPRLTDEQREARRQALGRNILSVRKKGALTGSK